MSNFLITLIFLTSTSQLPILQPQTIELEELTGTIVQKSWSKSQESYCIGGSKYFVLQYGDNLTITLKHVENIKVFTNFIDKQVMLEGYQQTTIISPNDRTPEGVISQTLVNPVSCVFFMVQNIK
ncbi:MAG: hypothetical protein QM487_15520 [Candidatus Marithrix sp.]